MLKGKNPRFDKTSYRSIGNSGQHSVMNSGIVCPDCLRLTRTELPGGNFADGRIKASEKSWKRNLSSVPHFATKSSSKNRAFLRASAVVVEKKRKPRSLSFLLRIRKFHTTATWQRWSPAPSRLLLHLLWMRNSSEKYLGEEFANVCLRNLANSSPTCPICTSHPGGGTERGPLNSQNLKLGIRILIVHPF